MLIRTSTVPLEFNRSRNCAGVHSQCETIRGWASMPNLRWTTKAASHRLFSVVAVDSG